MWRSEKRLQTASSSRAQDIFRLAKIAADVWPLFEDFRVENAEDRAPPCAESESENADPRQAKRRGKENPRPAPNYFLHGFDQHGALLGAGRPLRARQMRRSG